ncbi:hypothetical protein Tco_0890207 [Tanacetum coccineum]|uniref:Uncharacterized protein n=1 Tax=Tanacetum coccineum TaxID=301880 RepID=A0ABQ5BZU0_9ASTR
MQLMFIQMNCALPNKRYDLMDANKKVDLEHVQCPPKSKILMNIIKNHPLRFSIAASSSIPWIYMAQFWHTLKEDSSKYRLKFMLDKKELSFTLDDFRTIFYLPHVNDNNHNSFMLPPLFSDMVPFYKQQLGFTMELNTSSSFKTTGLPKTDGKHYARYFPNYVELLWEGIYYSLYHPTSSIPYPGFTKIIVSHYMTIFPEISRRAYDMYHNLQDDDIMKNIFNSGIHTDKVGMQIPDWMITEEMKHTEHIRWMHRRSTRLTPPAPVLTVDKADEMILQDTLQVSLAELQSQKSEEARKSGTGQQALGVLKILKRWLEPRSDKESPEVESTNDEEVEITNVVIPVNVNEEEDEITVKQQDISIWLALQIKFENLQNSAKVQKTSEYEAYVSGESSSGQVNEEERGPSTSVSQDIMEEVSLTIDEAKLKKIQNEMLRQKDVLQEEVRAEKIVLSLHKFPAIIFNDDDIEERTSRWVNKCVKKFNPYARYGVEHWKNPHAKIFYIKKQKEPGKPKEEVYSNSKIIQVIKTYWELGHEHKFITEIVARRANECIVSITEHDYKNLNKNDIEDMYLVIIIYEPVVLKGLKSYNNDVKFGYVQRELTANEVEYLKLFEEKIEVRLKYRNQMRRWEMYVNGRPLGPQRERPE